MIVGTAGHVDHGKTALVRALTGTDTDRLKEEKARGISIDLGFAYTSLVEGRVTGFVDVPGHERFVHTMAAGAAGIHYALLVVAADDGVMPQTREHLAILDLLGIGRGMVALTKADLADDRRRAEAMAKIRAALAVTSLRDAPIVPVSAQTGEGLVALRAELAQAERETISATNEGAFRLSVDRCFTLAGAGTIVTGTVLSGMVAVGDLVTISPSGLPARVRGIHAQNRPAARGTAGERCALNLAGERVDKDAMSRGDMVLDPSLHWPTARIDAELCLLASEAKPVGSWFPARLHHASAEVGVRLVPLGDPVEPGATGWVQLVLEAPIAAAVGDRFVLRDASAQRTIGGGRLLDLRAPARKRRTLERRAVLAALAAADGRAALRGLLSVPPFLVDLTAFARDRALSPGVAADVLAGEDVILFEVAGTSYALARCQWSLLADRLEAEVARFHEDNPDLQGIGREPLRLHVAPRLPKPVFLSALQRLAQDGRIVLDGAFVRKPEHAVRLSAADEAVWRAIEPHLCGAQRFRPPRVRDLAALLGRPEAEIRHILKLCARLGRVDEIAKDHFFARPTTREMVSLANEAAGGSAAGAFAAADFRDRMGNGRKVAIQILDFFDRCGITMRRGDLRRMNPHRLDLFGDPVAQEGRETSPVGRPDFKSG